MYTYIIYILYIYRILLSLKVEFENDLFDTMVQNLYNNHVMETINTQYLL